ncbi:hypothetical protein ECPA3_4221, partial [Escherichia coli PA3]
MLFSWQCYAPR